MKPNFALSLSLDGIRLLLRAAGGWRLVGEADVQSADLSAELAVLRRTAASLAPGGVRCKLVIPNEQIRYITIETPDMDAPARREAARIALDGATPYAVDDLAFDISEDGDKTHIAAVATETLAEAEAFAAEHRFHPVGFVATPADNDFLGEPYFGMTKLAASLLEPGESVVPDGIAIVVVGSVTLPDEGAQEDNGALPLITQVDAKPDVALKAGAPGDASLEDAKAQADLAQASFASRRGQLHAERTETVKRTTFASLETSATYDKVPGFADSPREFSARKPTAPPAPPATPPKGDAIRVTRPTAPGLAIDTEEERLTVFGARKTPRIGGKPRFLGLTLTVVLIFALAGVAAWASSFIGVGLSGMFERSERVSAVAPAAQFASPLQPNVPAIQTETQDPAEVALASIDAQLTDEDAAVLDALQSPILADPSPRPPLSDLDLRAQYAVTGIWPIAPDVPSPPALVDLEDLYVTSIDPISPAFDAVALPQIGALERDVAYTSPVSPQPAGTRFALDANGLVTPSSGGAVNPEGVLVYTGPPPASPPKTLLRIQEPGEDPITRKILSGFRPKSRPTNLIETTERATLGGLSRTELASFRPQVRPQSIQEQAAQEEEAVAVAAAVASASLVPLDNVAAPLSEQGAVDPIASATARAVAASLRPDARPNDFGAIVASARRIPAAPSASTGVQTASVAPRTVTPKIPSSASASREATVRNAINLRKVNLIGVYGKPSDRRALVRLANGRYKKVQVGDRIDGGQISAIGDAELRYQKSGRNVVLKMPKG